MFSPEPSPHHPTEQSATPAPAGAPWPAPGPAGHWPDRLAGLTDRERAIARLAGQGLTNRQIASLVFISPHTVNYHLRQVYRKLAIRSRIRLAHLVHRHGVPDSRR